MAYITQEEKKIIAAKLKSIIPTTWKYSLSISNHSTIICTVKSAPVLIGATNYEVNPYWIHQRGIKLINEIIAALNTNNYNRSDYQSDYHEVGHYIALKFGRYDAPFISIGSEIDLRQPVPGTWN